MATPNPTQQTHSAVIKRVFDAPRERVFRAWIDPDELKRWFGPEGVTTVNAEVDLRVGGEYKTVMQTPAGETVHHYGTYREINPPEKLVYTWVLDGQGCGGSEGEYTETLVTIEFHELGTSTEVVLTHEFLPSEKSLEGHTFGWNSSLDCLAQLLH